MRVLILHGYLLRGTGSNVYNAQLAQAMARLGHEVHLICQDHGASELDWVDAVGDWTEGSLTVRQLGRRPPGAGSITVYTPEIGGLLPVFVRDRYDGFEVKEFQELTDRELDDYLSANIAAVRDVVDRIGGVDAALANHLVANPVILARAGIGPFATKIHGSDLSYTVRPHPERFVPLAREGMIATSAALVGSLHTAESLWDTLDLDDLEAKTRLGPPGVDVEDFAPRSAEGDSAALAATSRALAAMPVPGADGNHDAFGRNPAEAAAAIEWFAAAEGPRVLFVGKLLVNKGVDLLIAAWPIVVAEHPGSRLLLAGFGSFRHGLEELLAALGQGDLDQMLGLAKKGRGLEDGGPDQPLGFLGSFLASPPEGYAEACLGAAGSIRISGRLEHSEVAAIEPAADALVMPSTFPEAFGMVTAEAAASGVLPISADHSGMGEVAARLAEVLDPEIASLLSCPLEGDPETAIAERLTRWLSLDPSRRLSVGSALSIRAGGIWSWSGVARGVIDASSSRLDALSPPR